MRQGEVDRWRGGFAVLARGWRVYVGALGRAEHHAHHAIQVLHAAEPVILRDGRGGQRECRAAVIPANVEHGIVRGTAHGTLLYVEPQSVSGRSLERLVDSPRAVDDWVAAAAPLAGAVLPTPAEAAPAALVARMLGLLDVAVTANAELHAALHRAVRLLPGMLHGPVRLADVAAAVGLSPSRLRHLFAAELGLPFRRYVLWLRLQQAAEHVLGGASLTDAAHAAGFADSAHLTKVTRATFGLTPSHLAHGVTRLPAPTRPAE